MGAGTDQRQGERKSRETRAGEEKIKRGLEQRRRTEGKDGGEGRAESEWTSTGHT